MPSSTLKGKVSINYSAFHYSLRHNLDFANTICPCPWNWHSSLLPLNCVSINRNAYFSLLLRSGQFKFVHSSCSLSCERSTASSEASSPQSAIKCLFLQVPVPPLLYKIPNYLLWFQGHWVRSEITIFRYHIPEDSNNLEPSISTGKTTLKIRTFTNAWSRNRTHVPRSTNGPTTHPWS